MAAKQNQTAPQTEEKFDVMDGGEAITDAELRQMERDQDVSGWYMDDELEHRLSSYADDDPVFAMHVKRAHKYYTQKPKARTFAPWEICVKGKDQNSNSFPVIVLTMRQSIPTPEDILAAGWRGKFKLHLKYYDPYGSTSRTLRKKNMYALGRVASIMSNMVFEVGAVTQPDAVFSPQSAHHVPPQMSGGAPGMFGQQHPAGGMFSQAKQPAFKMPNFNEVTDFNKSFEMIYGAAMQAVSLQMETVMNRDKIMEKGIEIGRMQQQLDDARTQNAELLKQIQEIQNAIQSQPSGGGGGDAVSSIVQAIAEKILGGGGGTSETPSGGEPQRG